MAMYTNGNFVTSPPQMLVPVSISAVNHRRVRAPTPVIAATAPFCKRVLPSKANVLRDESSVRLANPSWSDRP